MTLYKKDTINYTEHELHTQSYLFLVEDDDYTMPFDNLVNWGIQAPEVAKTDPVTIAKAVFRRGQIFTQNKVVRGATVTGYTFPILFPQGSFLATVLSRSVANFSNCEKNFYLVRICPEIAAHQHFIEFREGRLDPLEFSTDLVTVPDSPVPIEATSSLYTAEIWVYWYLQARETITAAEGLFAVAFSKQDCENCGNPNLVGAFGGGALSEILTRTTNGFASGTSIAPTLSQPVVTDIVYNGSVIVGTYADSDNPVTGTDGGVFVSNNDGASYTDVPLTVAMTAIAYGGGWYVAVGSNGTVIRSIDGVNWTTLTTPSNTDDLWDIAYDARTKTFWIVGVNGANSVVLNLRDDSVVSVTATVALGAVVARSVAVLGKTEDGSHILIGTTLGILRESLDGGATWHAVVSGTTSSIAAILGNSTRTLIGAGTGIYERSPLTEREFRQVAFDGGAFTGDITAGAEGVPDGGAFPGKNHFVFVTDDGEVVTVYPADPFVR